MRPWSWMIRALRAERLAKDLERQRDLTAELAARAIDKLSDDELLELREEMQDDADGERSHG